MDNVNVADIYKHFSNLSVKELIRYKTHLESVVSARTPADRKFVKALCIDKYVTEEGTIINDTQEAEILAELNSQKCFNSSKSTESLWITEDSDMPYEWFSKRAGTVSKSAVGFSEFKSVQEFMTSLNKKYGTDYNACLVQLYRDGSSGVRLHEDLEVTMDPNHPIGVLSVGAERRVEFLHNYQISSEPAVKTVNAKNGTLYVMEAGCQKYFRHRVPASKGVTKPRFSLSFRRFVPLSDSAENAKVMDPTEQCDATIQCEIPAVKAKIKHFDNLCTQTSPVKLQPVQMKDSADLTPCVPGDSATARVIKERDIVVVFGTSITRRMDCSEVSDADTEFMNVSTGGARIKNPKHFTKVPDIGTMMENFAAMNSDKIARVKSVVISVGTNDIKYFRKDMGRGRRAIPGDIGTLRIPLVNLVKCARYHFGKQVHVIFQSVIPMRLMYTYTAANFIGYNMLLQDICHDLDCGYMDVFGFFLDCSRMDYNRNLFVDALHLNRYGLQVLEKCYYDYFKSFRTR